MTEEWREIPGHEGRYEVSSFGRLRSVARRENYGRWGEGKTKLIKSCIRVQTPAQGGYMGISVRAATGKQIRIRTHIAVLRAFVGPCPDGMESCHNDGNVTNNQLSNLRWDTPSNNNRDKERHGTAQKGSKNGAAKLTEAQVAEIKKRLSAETQTALAAEFDVSITAIWQIKHGLKWQHV